MKTARITNKDLSKGHLAFKRDFKPSEEFPQDSNNDLSPVQILGAVALMDGLIIVAGVWMWIICV